MRITGQLQCILKFPVNTALKKTYLVYQIKKHYFIGLSNLLSWMIYWLCKYVCCDHSFTLVSIWKARQLLELDQNFLLIMGIYILLSNSIYGQMEIPHRNNSKCSLSPLCCLQWCQNTSYHTLSWNLVNQLYGFHSLCFLY